MSHSSSVAQSCHQTLSKSTAKETTNYERHQNSENYNAEMSKKSKQIFDRKKSSALRNTTLEEICENKREEFIGSPSKYQ